MTHQTCFNTLVIAKHKFSLLSCHGTFRKLFLKLFATDLSTSKQIVFFCLTFLRVNVSNFQLGPCNSEKTKNLKKILKKALGELLLKIYILPRSHKYFGRTEINLVSQLSDQILGVWYRTPLRPPLKIKTPFPRNSKQLIKKSRR